MGKNSRELIDEAASILGKRVVGEALGNIEYQTIDYCIDPVLAEIQDIAYIGDRDDIPDRYFQTIARLLAIHAAAKFSNVPADYQAIIQHENRLRYLAAGASSRQVAVAEYF